MRRARQAAAALVAGFGVLLATACSGVDEPVAEPLPTAPVTGTAEPSLAPFYDQDLAWAPCQGVPGEEGFECATMRVPLDWDAVEGDAIELALTRLPADQPTERIGSLVLNPGGPGGSGVEFAQTARDSLGVQLRRAFDIVGFDPRGVGASAPVECVDDAALDELLAAESTPDDEVEVEVLRSSFISLSGDCERGTGPLLGEVDTLNVVRDMDVLRDALGDERLTYLGASYGTFLGVWYADTFPQRVGRLVLDGGVDPSLSNEGFLDGQAMGFRRAFEAFHAFCVEQGECPLRGTLDDGIEAVVEMIARADASPLRTDSERDLTQSLMVTGLITGLYDNLFWPVLASAIGGGLTGQGTDLLALADAYAGRDTDGSYAGNLLEANIAVSCADRDEPRTLEEIAAQAERLAAQYPPFGESLGWGGLACLDWPLPSTLPVAPLAAQGAAPILVVGTTRDPATPLEWSQSLASQLSSGVLLTFDGDGHTAYRRGSGCVDDAVEGYLLRGDVPADGTTC